MHYSVISSLLPGHSEIQGLICLHSVFEILESVVWKTGQEFVEEK